MTKHALRRIYTDKGWNAMYRAHATRQVSLEDAFTSSEYEAPKQAPPKK